MELSPLSKITKSVSSGGDLDSLLHHVNPDMLSVSSSSSGPVSPAVSSQSDDPATTSEESEQVKKSGRNIPGNAARERSRVKTLRTAFQDLQKALPSVPPDTKLSKLDVLVLANTYIRHLMQTLEEGTTQQQCQIDWSNTINSHLGGGWTCKGYYHPVKKWPMRSRLYTEMTQKSKDTGVKLPTNMTSVKVKAPKLPLTLPSSGHFRYNKIQSVVIAGESKPAAVVFPFIQRIPNKTSPPVLHVISNNSKRDNLVGQGHSIGCQVSQSTTYINNKSSYSFVFNKISRNDKPETTQYSKAAFPVVSQGHSSVCQGQLLNQNKIMNKYPSVRSKQEVDQPEILQHYGKKDIKSSIGQGYGTESQGQINTIVSNYQVQKLENNEIFSYGNEQTSSNIEKSSPDSGTSHVQLSQVGGIPVTMKCPTDKQETEMLHAGDVARNCSVNVNDK